MVIERKKHNSNLLVFNSSFWSQCSSRKWILFSWYLCDWAVTEPRMIPACACPFSSWEKPRWRTLIWNSDGPQAKNKHPLYCVVNFLKLTYYLWKILLLINSKRVVKLNPSGLDVYIFKHCSLFFFFAQKLPLCVFFAELEQNDSNTKADFHSSSLLIDVHFVFKTFVQLHI